MRIAKMLYLFLPVVALAQEANSGFELRSTFTVEAVNSQQLVSAPRFSAVMLPADSARCSIPPGKSAGTGL